MALYLFVSAVGVLEDGTMKERALLYSGKCCDIVHVLSMLRSQVGHKTIKTEPIVTRRSNRVSFVRESKFHSSQEFHRRHPKKRSNQIP